MSTVRVNKVELNQEGNTFLTVTGTSNVSVVAGNVERLRIDASNGVVSVNTSVSSGSYQLEVTGKTYSSGGFIGGFASNASVSSPLSWNSDSYAQYSLTALANTLTINADSGSPVDGQKMTFRIKDSGVSRVVTFTGGSSKSFRNIGTSLTANGSNVALTTTASKISYIGCIYNAADARWDIVTAIVEA
jgi:hypothetical protein